MKRLHIVGRKNSGKTTLICELVKELTARGHRVGTIKHTHHHHELDTPGKDSHRHRESGSVAVGILSPAMNAVFWPKAKGASAEHTKETSYASFDGLMSDCDLVLVEGDSSASQPKIEVYRAENQSEPIAASDTSIRAVVTDDPLGIDTPIWPRNDVPLLIEKILSLVG